MATLLNLLQKKEGTEHELYITRQLLLLVYGVLGEDPLITIASQPSI